MVRVTVVGVTGQWSDRTVVRVRVTARANATAKIGLLTGTEYIEKRLEKAFGEGDLGLGVAFRLKLGFRFRSALGLRLV